MFQLCQAQVVSISKVFNKFVTARQRSCGKVMISQLSVILSACGCWVGMPGPRSWGRWVYQGGCVLGVCTRGRGGYTGRGWV